MFRRTLACTLVLLLVSLVPLGAADQAETIVAGQQGAEPAGPSGQESIIVDGRIQLIVGHALDPVAPLAAALAETGAELIRTDTTLGFSVVQVPVEAEETFRTRATFSPDVTYVKRDGTIRAYLIPDDTLYDLQWGPPAIGMEAAWDIATGHHNVTVAVIDTGVDYTHPDLAGNVCGTGRDFINDDLDAMDDHAHGTHVAGTIAAHIGNGTGVAGMAEVCILPVKALGASGGGSWSGLASAITWTADQGVDIISMSLGGCAGCDPGSPMPEAMQYAVGKGVLIIAAAGNAGCDAVGYPAAYPEAVAVASLDAPGDSVSSFSSCGPEVEVAAPGRDVISTVPTFRDASGYATFSGTSMATPHVSGAAALLKSTAPALSAEDIRCILAQRADDLLYSGHDNATGYGRIDALDMLLNPVCMGSLPVAPVLSTIAGDLSAHLAWNRPFAWGGIDGYDIYMGVGDAELTLAAQVGDVRTHKIGGLSAGTTYRFAIAAWNDAGVGEVSDIVTFVAREALTVPYGLDFEGGLTDWTTTGLWHLTTDRSASGRSAYFGVEGASGLGDNGYATGQVEKGDLTSPPIRLPDAGPIALTFWQHANLSHGLEEHPILQLATDADATAFQDVWEMSSIVHEGTAAADLSVYAGQVVWLRFHVDTIQASYNAGEGWYVDDLALTPDTVPALAPLVDIVYPEPGVVLPADSGIGVFATDPNGQADLATVNITLDAIALTVETFADFAFFGRFTDATTGAHLAEVTVADFGGLVATDGLTVDVDGDGPLIGALSPAPGGLFGCTVTVSGTASDDLTGVAMVGVGVGYDPVTGDPSGMWHVPLEYVSYYPAQPSVDWSMTLSTAYLDIGDHVLSVAVWDDAGNLARANRTITKEDVICVPQVTVTAPAPDSVVGCIATVTGTVQAPEGRTLRYAFLYIDGEAVQYVLLSGAADDFTFDTTFTHVPAGPVTLTISAVDSQYDVGSTSLGIVRDDIDCLPQVVIESPAEGTMVACSATVDVRATAGEGSTLDYAILLVDGMAIDSASLQGTQDSASFVADFVSSDPGQHSVRVLVYQWPRAGNYSEPLTVERDDTYCYPTGEILLPPGDAAVGCTVSLSGIARAGSAFGLWRANFYVDGTAVGGARILGANGGSGLGVWEGSARLGELTPGAHTIEVTLADRRDNEASIGSVDVMRDATDCAPELELTTPNEGDSVGCGVNVAGVARDARGMERIEIHAGDVLLHDWTVEGKEVPFEMWVDGFWIDWYGAIRVVVTNQVGGVNETSRSLVYDPYVDCRPIITIETPTDGGNVSGSSLVTGSFTAKNLPLTGYVSAWVDGSFVDSYHADDGTFRFYVDWTRFPDGPSTLMVSVSLDEGDWNSTTIDITIDNTVDPVLQTWSHEGTVGCSGKVGGVWVKDACGERIRRPVDAGLTGGRLVLTWETDAPDGIDHLGILVTIGARQWTATALAGDGSLVLDITGTGYLTEEATEAVVEVTAGHDGSPLVVAVLEGFHLDGQWAYGGATPTL